MGPPLESHIYCYLIICYKHYLRHDILLRILCPVMVLNSLYSFYMTKVTWREGRLDGLLGLVEWMSLDPYPSLHGGHGSAGYRQYKAPWASCFLFHAYVLADNFGLNS